jgi:hypothetical protein
VVGLGLIQMNLLKENRGFAREFKKYCA